MGGMGATKTQGAWVSQYAQRDFLKMDFPIFLPGYGLLNADALNFYET